jgi:hypothetical protein
MITTRTRIARAALVASAATAAVVAVTATTAAALPVDPRMSKGLAKVAGRCVNGGGIFLQEEGAAGGLCYAYPDPYFDVYDRNGQLLGSHCTGDSDVAVCDD